MLNTFAMLGGQELIIVALVVLVLFGGKKIPELMRGVGQGMGELKKGMEEGQRHVQDALRHDDPPAAAPVPVATVSPANPVTPTATTPNSTPVP